jgi:membrane-associated phospholipid phosphatase
LFYLVGIVTASQLAFFSETFFPLRYGSFPTIYFTLTVSVLIPCIFITAGFSLKDRGGFVGMELSRLLAPSYQEPPKSFFRRFDWLFLAMLVFGLWSGGYTLVEHLSGNGAMHSLQLPPDLRVPYKPEYVWFYLTVYPFFLVPFFVLNDKRLANTVMLSYLTVMVICYSCFLLYPVEYPRTELPVNTFSTWALKMVHNGDRPWNCFPSSHCALSLMAALVLFEVNPWFGAWGIASAFMIGVSTLFTKQHFIIDWVAGFGLTSVVYYAFFKSEVVQILNDKPVAIYRRIEGTIGSLLESINRIVR